MSSIGLILVGVLVIGAVAPIRAQSLADIAKKEEERRRSTKKSGKVYTNQDLSPVPGSGSGDATSDKAAAAGDAKDASTAKDKKDSKDGDKDAKADDKKSGDTHGEEYWSKRIGGLREALQRDEVYAEALQSRINALTTDFVNRDDPAQRAQIGVQRDTAVNELNRLKKQIEDDRKTIADTEEEARRSGVPPGWLR